MSINSLTRGAIARAAAAVLRQYAVSGAAAERRDVPYSFLGTVIIGGERLVVTIGIEPEHVAALATRGRA